MDDSKEIDEPARRKNPTPPGSTGSKEQSKKKRYEIDIFRGWCKSCGICASFCPRDCIQLDQDGTPQVLTAERCTGCRWCELHCPDFAISVREKSTSQGQRQEV